MPKFKIHHRTHYRYHQPVRLGPHRLMLRPRESHKLRLISTNLTITPVAVLDWAQDVYGNALATANFQAMADNLLIDSFAEVELHSSAWPVFPIAATAIAYPFVYSDDQRKDLGALATPQPDDGGKLEGWARSFIRSNPTDTLALLKDLNAGIPQQICYQSRDDEGTQSPLQTLARGWGSCRDFAVLFVEAARVLGFGARIVSGYITNSDPIAQPGAGGTTHAWAEVFVPGAGWIAFDPTNNKVGDFNLIPVAVARDIAHAMPVSGTFVGAPAAFDRMTVEVKITELLSL